MDCLGPRPRAPARFFGACVSYLHFGLRSFTLWGGFCPLSLGSSLFLRTSVCRSCALRPAWLCTLVVLHSFVCLRFPTATLYFVHFGFFPALWSSFVLVVVGASRPLLLLVHCCSFLGGVWWARLGCPTRCAPPAPPYGIHMFQPNHCLTKLPLWRLRGTTIEAGLRSVPCFL